jgi:hypothetical protein
MNDGFVGATPCARVLPNEMPGPTFKTLECEGEMLRRDKGHKALCPLSLACERLLVLVLICNEPENVDVNVNVNVSVVLSARPEGRFRAM